MRITRNAVSTLAWLLALSCAKPQIPFPPLDADPRFVVLCELVRTSIPNRELYFVAVGSPPQDPPPALLDSLHQRFPQARFLPRSTAIADVFLKDRVTGTPGAGVTAFDPQPVTQTTVTVWGSTFMDGRAGTGWLFTLEKNGRAWTISKAELRHVS